MENERKEAWIQLVMVRFEPAHDAYLYRAHRFSCNAGDTVLVNFGGTRYGKVLAAVDKNLAHESDYKAVRRVADAFGAAWPLPPILKLVVEYEMEFDEEDWSPEDEKEEETDDAVRTE